MVVIAAKLCRVISLHAGVHGEFEAGRGGWEQVITATHPPIELRLEALEQRIARRSLNNYGVAASCAACRWSQSQTCTEICRPSEPHGRRPSRLVVALGI